MSEELLPDPKFRPVLTVPEAAKVLDISRGSAYAAVDAGEIPSIRLGRRIVVPTAALARLLDQDATAIR